MNLTWASSSGATSYLIEREILATGTWSDLDTSSGTSYHDATYGSGGYHYRVRAVNSAGASGPSSEFPRSRYVLIDLGAGMSPVKVTASGMVLMGKALPIDPVNGAPYPASNTYRWQNGTATQLLPPAGWTPPLGTALGYLYGLDRGPRATDIAENGMVVGSMPKDSPYVPGPTYITTEATWAPPSTTGTPPSTEQATINGGVPPTENFWISGISGGYYASGSYDDAVATDGVHIWSNRTVATTASYANEVGIILDAFKNGTELGSVIYAPAPVYGISQNPETEVQGVNSAGQALLYNIYVDLNTAAPYSPSFSTTLDKGDGTTTDVVSLTTSWGPYFVHLSNINLANNKTYVIGSNDTGAIWWDGAIHQDGFTGASFYAVNARTATVNGTLMPAVQIVGEDVNGNQMIWEMSPTTGQFGSGLNLSDLMTANSGWSSPIPAWINDLGAIVGTATYTTTGTLDPIAVGSHGVLLLPVQINAYRPQMVPNSVDLTPTDPTKLIIPQSEVQSSGVHIRVNADNDVDANGNFTNLVKVTFSSSAIAAMSNVHVAVQSGSSNLWVYSDAQASSSIAIGGSQGNLTLDANGNATIWIEARAQGGNDLTFLLTSGTTTIGTLGKLHFVNYDSFVEAFSGETFGTPGAASAGSNQGVFNVAQNLYLEGYNIAYYDVHTISSSTSQPAFGEISDQISSGFVTNVGVFGYSHGGGETYNTCNLLTGTAATISFAGYIDAIEFAPPHPTQDFFSQTTYPPGAAFMWNYYETNDTFLHSGPVTGANVNLNVNTTAWGANLYHSTRNGHTGIAASPNVQADLQSAVESHVSKY